MRPLSKRTRILVRTLSWCIGLIMCNVLVAMLLPSPSWKDFVGTSLLCLAGLLLYSAIRRLDPHSIDQYRQQ